ncbi:MAG: SPASM domain-containing protein [Candidatus Gastranaerophilales bacterium]|nr:SPASM domain-containing protein [Candidatus Gastranaerophilales bacterium]
MRDEICPYPFQNIEIHISGDVYTCCPNWNNHYAIGNIYKHSFEEVWNSAAAIDLRQRILNKDYSLCDKDNCFLLKEHWFYTDYEINFQSEMKDYPLIIKFAYDPECNIACKICRDKINRLPDDELKLLDSKIDTFFLPMLKHAKILIINSAGDPFGSRHSRKVTEKAAKLYPDLKFIFHTNGILCNEKMLKTLGINSPISNKIHQMQISMHAATAKTYDKIVPGGIKLFPQIIKNLDYLSKNKIELFLNFVVTPDNFREIPDFINLAEKYHAMPNFWEYKPVCCSYDNKEDLFILREDHPLHNELIKVLKYPKIRFYKHVFSPALCNLM